MSNSAFTPTVLTIPATGGGGTGQGELSLITNGSAVTDITGWTNVSRVTSNSPLNPLIPTAFSISNAAGAENSTSGGYASFTLPTGLQNRKLKVEFYYTTPATDVYRVSVYKGSTRVPLSTDSSNVTTLPANTTGKFTAYFDTDTSASWSLNVTRTNGTTGPVYITNVVVGPGIQPQGAVVGEWQSYTPTLTNITLGNGTLSGRWRRVGSQVEVNIALNSGTTTSYSTSDWVFGLPSNLTMTNVEGLCTILGTAVGRFNDAADGESRNGFVVPETSPNQGTAVRIKTAPNAANYSALYWNATTTGVTNNITNTVFSLQFSASIAEWAGSGTVQLAQNDVEYAYNTSTSTTSDTTSFGYGPTGVSFTAMAPTGTNTIEKRVRFQTPIQTTDRLVLEIFNGVNWTAAEQSIGGYTTNDTATVSYGQLIRPTVGSSTDVSVLFASATAGQSTWATTASYGFKWRVRKSSAGAAVGFGLAAQAQSGLISQEVSGTFTGTLTGVSTTVTGTCRYTVVGKMVTLFLPDMTGTSNTTVQCTITGLPAVITPQRGQWVMGTFTDNGAQGLALHEVSTAGTVKANRFTAINSITGGTTGSGTKGFATQTLTYSLD